MISQGVDPGDALDLSMDPCMPDHILISLLILSYYISKERKLLFLR